MPKARLIDVSKCMGCRGCQVACKQWNDLPAVSTTQVGTYENPPHLSANTWIKVEFHETAGSWTFRAHTCMHCTEASCVSVCPTGAARKEGEITIIDQDWCIGCGYCVVACPFGAVNREGGPGTARKCRMCIDRIQNGYEPACAKTCPPDAIQFGERAEMLRRAHARVASLRANGYSLANVYGEYELGGLQTLYVLTDSPAKLGLPESPKLATSTVMAQWLSGVLTASLVAAVPLWVLFRRHEAEEESRVGGARR